MNFLSAQFAEWLSSQRAANPLPFSSMLAEQQAVPGAQGEYYWGRLGSSGEAHPGILCNATDYARSTRCTQSSMVEHKFFTCQDLGSVSGISSDETAEDFGPRLWKAAAFGIHIFGISFVNEANGYSGIGGTVCCSPCVCCNSTSLCLQHRFHSGLYFIAEKGQGREPEKMGVSTGKIPHRISIQGLLKFQLCSILPLCSDHSNQNQESQPGSGCIFIFIPAFPGQ